MSELKPHMTLAGFRTLKRRDFENGAVLDEIYASIKRMETAEAKLAATQWQPIETAPKTGEYFIAWDPKHGLLFSMYWHDEFLTVDEQWSGMFTHWMPLPEPPEETK